MRKLLSFVAASLTLAACGSAQAAWHKASSSHFVIYADQDPERLRELATRLEKFDKAVQLIRNVKSGPTANKVTIFMVEDLTQLRGLLGYRNSGLAGMYKGRASGPLAFVPRTTGTGRKGEVRPESVFFHEYAHHLMFQNSNFPMPQWLSEGFAEFMGQATFTDEGAIGLGLVPRHREYGLHQAVEVPLEQLLTGNYKKLHGDQVENLYARGWLLYHYLNLEPSRKGQLDIYLKALAAGAAPLAAAQNAFGNLAALERDLTKYVGRAKLRYIQLPASALPTGPITVAPLSKAEAAIFPVFRQSQAGVDEKTAGPTAARARAIAQYYPADAFVQTALAEAELDAKNFDAAAAAADRAIQADPRAIQAMIYKGRAIMERASAQKDSSPAVWNEARRWFLSANKIENEDPEPLMLFYESFVGQGIAPTNNAVDALHFAHQLAPQDPDLRWKSAVQHLRDGKMVETRRTLMPIAWHPHAKGIAERARELLALVNAGKRTEALALAAKAPEEAEDEDDKKKS